MGKAKNCCECGWDLESYPFRKITTGCESEVWSCSGWEMQIRLTDVGRWRVMSSEWLPTSPVIPQDMMTTCTPWTLALVPCSTVFRSIQCDPLIEITSLTFSLLCPCASLQLFFGCFLPFFIFSSFLLTSLLSTWMKKTFAKTCFWNMYSSNSECLNIFSMLVWLKGHHLCRRLCSSPLCL